MFPLKYNEPYIKDTGERSTLGKMLSGGSSPIPSYSISDAGKVLGVNAQGNLEWVTISAAKTFGRAAVNIPVVPITTNAKEGTA